MSLETTIKNVPFFDHLNNDQLQSLASVGEVQPISADEVVVKQGDPADALYILLQGSMRVTALDTEGNDIELTILDTGAFFGESALFDGGTRTATVAAVDRSEVFILSRQAFIDLLASSKELLSDVLGGISSKIKETNERFFQEMLQKQKVRAEMEIERHRSLSQMVAGVAHEINTPLGIVNTAASLIADNLRDEDLQEAAEDNEDVEMVLEDLQDAAVLIQGNIARANKLIQTFKSISVNQVTDTLEEVLFTETLKEILDLFKVSARQSNLDIHVQTDEIKENYNEWTGYPGYLTQIIMNLLTNVDRYAYPDGEGGKVSISITPIQLKNNQPGYQMIVQDFGKGIVEQDLSKVFEAFFTTGRSKGGTGLGMSIVHNIITTAFQGDIDLKSVPGEGTSFIMKFPQVIQEAE